MKRFKSREIRSKYLNTLFAVRRLGDQLDVLIEELTDKMVDIDIAMAELEEALKEEDNG